MKLTIRKSDLDDWYMIERAEHDGRTWMEPVGAGGLALRCSSRFSDADVEGTAAEMLAIASAIQQRGRIWFKRCAVDAQGDRVTFWSPRNSIEDGYCTIAEADELARLILVTVTVPNVPQEGAEL